MTDTEAFFEFHAWARGHSKNPDVDVSSDDFVKMYQDAVEYFKDKEETEDEIDRLRFLSLESMKNNYLDAENLIDDFTACSKGEVLSWETFCGLILTRTPWLLWVTFLRLRHLSGGP